jgi:hypothetical protein
MEVGLAPAGTAGGKKVAAGAVKDQTIFLG